jgi:23S rRNA pseudouridine2605 synthase
VPKNNDLPDNDKIRLNKYISNSGYCSRREADSHITSGVVTVNDNVVTELGTKVSFNDKVKVKNKLLSPEKKVYILLNKPRDYITTVSDPQDRKTVMELVKNACKERIYPVGRLDRNTTGLLLLTNDGELAKKLMHPSSNMKKIYHVILDRNFDPADMDKLIKGVELDTGTFQVDAADYADPADNKQLGVEIHSGENRIVRRLFEALGYEVKNLDRVLLAGLTKKNLRRGKWRFLNGKEVAMLKMHK